MILVPSLNDIQSAPPVGGPEGKFVLLLHSHDQRVSIYASCRQGNLVHPPGWLMSYEFTRYQSRYREEVVQLQTAAYWIPDLALSAAYLAWKYDQNPYLSEPHIYLAVQNQRVVGMRGLYGTQWKIGRTGETVILPCAGDTIIAPEHRNRGLLRQLLRFQHAD